MHADTAQKFAAQMKAELEQKAMTEPPVADGTASTHRPTPQSSPDPQAIRVAPTTLTLDPWYDDGLGWGLAGTGLLAVGVSAAVFPMLRASTTTTRIMRRHKWK